MKGKKFLAMLMSVCMSMGVLACGADTPDPGKESSEVSGTEQESSEVSGTEQESSEEVVVERVEIDESKFAGKTLVYGGRMEYDNQAYLDNPKSISFNHYWEPLVTVALAEWCAKNDVTLEIKGGNPGFDELQASIVAGDPVDIVVLGPYGNGPEYGLFRQVLKPATEYYNNFADYATYAVEGGISGDEWYGVRLPYTNMRCLIYSKKYFDERGVKRPDEYFMEGNWTWETFQEVCEEIGGDTDGDGIVDVYAVANYHEGSLSNALAPEVIYDSETSQYVILAESDKNMESYQVIHELYSQDLVFDGFLQYPSKSSDGKYVAMGYGIHVCGYIEQDFPFTAPEEFMTVPMPAYKAGEEFILSSAPFLGIGKTGDTEMAVSAMEYVMKFFESYTAVRRRVLTKEEGLGWFTPQTPAGERLMFVMDKMLLNSNWEEELAKKGIDYAYVEAYRDYIYNTPVVYYLNIFMDNYVSYAIRTDHSIPPATIAAQQIPILEAKVKELNDLLK